MRILFVDDEPRVLEGLRRAVGARATGWAVSFAGSADDAMVQLSEQPFDVIVSDLEMPVVNGVELLRRVATKHPEMGRLVLSGHCDSSLASEARAIAHEMLAKPADRSAVMAAIVRVNAQRSQGSLDHGASHNVSYPATIASRMRVLIVDDDIRLLSALSRIAARHFDVETALGGAAGLERVATSRPFHVIVSDLHMPGMDGVRFLHLAREASPHSGCLLLSGSTGESVFMSEADARAFRTLAKPVPVDELVAAIHVAAREAGAHQPAH